MSFALVEDVAASWESYERLGADIERSRPDGLILHAAGRTDEGFRIIEVWESEAAWRRFAEHLDPPEAPRFIRELQPTHLVLGGGSTSTDEPSVESGRVDHEGGRK